MTAPIVERLVAPIIKLNGQELGAVALNNLVGMRITRSLRLPGRCILHFEDYGFALSAGTTFSVGTTVTVNAGSTLLFAGEVTGIDLDLERGVPTLAVQVDDLAYKLTLGSKVRTFTNVSYADVINTIARESGLTARVDTTPILTGRHDYLLQSDSNFGFVDEIAERTGSDWWVLDSTLHFGPPDPDSTAAATVELGEDLLRFSLRANALHPMKATVRGWSQKLKQEVVGISNRSSVPLPDSDVVQGHLQQNLQPTAEVITSSLTPMDVTEAETMAGQLAARWRVGAVTARGTARINPAIVPGVAVTVTGVGPGNGLYHISEVEHSYSARGFETRFTAGDRTPTGLVDQLGGSANTSSFRQLGLVVGVVTEVGDARNSDLSKVKVKFPALGEIESGWARVVSVGGGARRGVTFMPEINDEVLVAFEGGDVRRPLVIGGLFNGRDVADEFGVANNKVEKRRITSRLGHYVEMGDGTATSAQHIAMMLAGGSHTLRLGKDKLTAQVPAGTPVSIKAGNSSIEISDSGAIVISGTSITLKAQQDVTIEGLNINTKAKVKAATSATMFEATATATAKISASGPLELGGAVVKVN